ncbi:MAG: hypothetical protein H0W61_03810 [Bacteroidetes bacterium]|nr:hypothetical protein [Bacteroidota bacterium]
MAADQAEGNNPTDCTDYEEGKGSALSAASARKINEKEPQITQKES